MKKLHLPASLDVLTLCLPACSSSRCRVAECLNFHKDKSLSPKFFLFQVHLHHLCTPLAHLGSWPPPPINSILVPPNFPLHHLPSLLLAHQKPKQQQPGVVMIRHQAPIHSGLETAPMRELGGGPIVFNRPPPPPPPRVNPSNLPWINRPPLQTNQQSNFLGNKQIHPSFQPNKQTTFDNNNQVMRPKFFPSRKNPGKPRPLRKNLNQEQKDEMTENSQNVPPPGSDDSWVFKASDSLQAGF